MAPAVPLSAAKRELLERRLRGHGAAGPPIPRHEGPPPLSFAQERLWFMEHLAPGTAAYTIPLALRLRGPLDPVALRGALGGVVARHETLRARFPATGDGRPAMEIAPPGPVELRLAAADGERAAADLLRAEAARPFDLAAGPPLRALLVRLADEDHALLIAVHHIACDGWSADVLLDELLAGYAGEPLAEPALRYRDHAAWQRERLAGPAAAADLAWWRERLAGVPALELPGDHPRPAEMRFEGAAHWFRLDRELSQAVAGLGRARGATLHMTLLAAFQAVLSRWTGQRDFAVGTPVAGRPRPDLERLVGLFVNMLTLRADLDGDPSFAELLRRTRETALEAYARQEAPFEQIVTGLNVPRDVGRTPLFQAVFALQNYGLRAPAPPGLRVEGLPLETVAARYDLELFCWETDAGLEGVLTYRADLFEAATIERLAGHLEALLRAAVADPDARVSALDVLGPAERALLDGWSRAEPAAPPIAGLHELIDRAVAAAPGAPAVAFADRTLTYAELDGRANRLARRLRRLGVGPESRVGVCVEPSVDVPVAVLGVLRAGGAYVPVDPDQPAERRSRLLAGAGADVVVTAEDVAAAVDAEAGGPVAAGVRPDSLAYVIHTSGSTGRPRGVAVQHREALNYLAGVRERLGVAPGATYGLAQSLAFDFGLTMLLLALSTGGCLRLLPRRLGGAELAEHLRRWPLDVLKLTPSHLAALAAEVDARELLPRRLLVLGGEASSLAWARDLAAACRVVNHYGPTETTVGVTTFQVDAPTPTLPRGGREHETTPIGRPLAHARVHVLDSWLRPVPAGGVGEICVGGERLARGYLDQPGPTAERFVPDPHGARGARLYRTGDLGRWSAGGDLEFLGRRDRQVKVRGYRVEPGEVEAALVRCPGVAQAVVEVRDQRLVAYLVAEAGRPPAADPRRLLRAELPDHLVPSRCVWLDRLPLQAHGKIDRAALPEPAAEPSGAAAAPPGGPVEEAIAAAWAAVLGVERVGALDDFFDLGGHSLLAMRAVARIRRALPAGGRPVTVMDLFKHPTVRGLAELVAAPAPAGPRSLLHELTPPFAGEPRLSLVCAPYGGGSAVVYQPLADALPAGCALHALAIPGHDPGLVEETLPLEEVARRCAAEVLERVAGPVVLYGHCGVGGALIADVASRLEAAGRPPEAVYVGGIFPFARPEGRVLGRLARAAGAEWLRGDRAHANWLRSMGSDVGDLDPEERRRTIRSMRRDTRAAEAYFTGRVDAELDRIGAPVISVVGERDPSTDYHQERFREWQFLGRSAALVVLSEGGHYFLKHRAAELAQIVTTVHGALTAGGCEALTRPARAADATWWLGGVAEGAGGPARPAAAPVPSMRRFLGVAASQLVSITGSAVTEFAVPLWIYLTTGSLVQFALFAVAGLVPGILVAPLAGAVVDRSDRRRVMLAGDCGAGLTLVAMAALLVAGRLHVWEIYALVACLSVALTFQRLAYNSAIPQLVPKRYLGHANGVVQMAGGMAQFVVPLVAVALVASIGLGGILALDVASYAVSVAVVLLVRFPAAMAHTRRESLGAEIVGGIRYSVGRRGFRAMLGFFALLNVFLAPLLMLLTPLLLSFTTLAAVAPVSIAGAAGATAGGLAMAAWGGPVRRRMRGVLAATGALAACSVVVGVRASAVLVAAGWFGMLFWLAIVNGIYATIIQVKVPQRFHGRVIALNTLVAWSTLPLGFGVIAPLGARLAEPLMARGGPLAATAGAVIGVGPGRGIGLLYVAFGLAMGAIALGGLGQRALARFDDEVPDAVADDVAGVEALRRRGGA
jgi:amino acid adenylation domain-containing protein